MKSSTITAFVLVKQAWHFYDDSNRRNLQLVVNELETLSGELVVPVEQGYTLQEVRIETVRFPSSKKDLGKWLLTTYGLDDSVILRFAFSIEVPDEPVEFSDKPGTKRVLVGQEAYDCHICVVCDIIRKRIHDMVLAANIAYPDSLELRRIAFLTNDSYYTTFDEAIYSYLFNRACRVARDLAWPNLGVVDFRTVWNWAIKNSGFLDGFGGGPLGRSLNALSNALICDNASQILWIMMAIEALYLKGSESIMEQLKGKATALLGPITKPITKEFKDMYRFRSNVVHGKADLPGTDCLVDATKEFSSYFDEFERAIGLATAILVATLQEMARKGLDALEFKYVLDS